jgi:hypothetical protein
VITQTERHGISAPEAARLADITYRQLDYWARRGWLPPSVEAGTGRPGRRLYSPCDVLRLAALGHLGRSGADVGQLGPQVATLELPVGDVDYVVVLGPELSLEVVRADRLRAHVSVPAQGGGYIVFDPAPLRRQLGLATSASSSRTLTQARTA